MWLISIDAWRPLEQAYNSKIEPTATQSEAFAARTDGPMTGERIATTRGATTTIAIEGVMTRKPDIFAMLFGGGNTTYGEIAGAIATAEADPAVENIELKVHSPGGTVDGLFDAIASMQTATKPITAVVENAQSAAYGLVSQADEIVAAGKHAMFGSIGVAVEAFVSDHRIAITSTESPNKRPDLKTEAGRAVVREELDALHELFVDAIATGRGATIDKVNADFGRGSTLVAKDAQRRGMVDRIVGESASPITATGGNQPEITAMDLTTLKAQHPDVYAAAKADGQAEERERVSAHLIMGESSGDMKTAIAAAKDGTEMTMSLQATYMAAGMNRSDADDRQADDSEVAEGADGAQAAATQQDAFDDNVAALVVGSLGGGAA